MESRQTTKPEEPSNKRDMSPKLMEVLGRPFAKQPPSSQDIQDALSLVNSHVPGGDRVTIEKIGEYTGVRWTRKRAEAALALAGIIRSLRNHPSFTGREGMLPGGSAPSHATIPAKEEPAILAGGETGEATLPSSRTDRLKRLEELREGAVRGLAEFMEVEEGVIQGLLSTGNKRFTADQVDLVERVKDKLGLNGKDAEQTTKWIKDMASKEAPTSVCRRLGQFLGVAFHRDNRGRYSIEQVKPKPIGEIRRSAKRGKNDDMQAETDLLNGLVVAIALKSPRVNRQANTGCIVGQ